MKETVRKIFGDKAAENKAVVAYYKEAHKEAIKDFAEKYHVKQLKFCVEKIKSHITGCEKSKKIYLTDESYSAAGDMKSRITGFKIALEYIEKTIETKQQ